MWASRRSGGDRTENALAIALECRRASGAEILDLTVGNPTECDLPYDTDAIREALSDARVLRYQPAPFGIPSAREAVAFEISRDGVDVPAERVVLTASTSEAYGFLFKLCCDPGDEVLVPRPGYPLFDGLARYEAVVPVGYRVAWDGQWHLDLASVRSAITDRTRAIAVVSPANPTGHYLKRDELDALASLGLPLICDEVFGRYPLSDDPRRVSTALRDASDARVPVFVLGGLSKLVGLPQMKLGWIAVTGPDDAVAEALARLEHVADAWLSVAAPVQVAAPALLAAGATTREAIRERVRSQLEVLRAALEGSSATVLPVEGGWYAVVRLPRVKSEESWCLGLLEDDGVLVHPGWLYDFEGEAHAIVSLIVAPPIFAEGAARLAARVRADAPC